MNTTEFIKKYGIKIYIYAEPDAGFEYQSEVQDKEERNFIRFSHGRKRPNHKTILLGVKTLNNVDFNHIFGEQSEEARNDLKTIL